MREVKKAKAASAVGNAKNGINLYASLSIGVSSSA